MQHGEGRLHELSGRSLRTLHRGAIDSPREVRALLERAALAGVELASGVDRRSSPRRARIAWIRDDCIGLDTENIECGDQPQIYLQFDLDASRYFFAAPPLRGGGDSPLEIAFPAAVYQAERRDLFRERMGPEKGAPSRVELNAPGSDPTPGEVRDWSYQGMGVAVPHDPFRAVGSSATLRFLDGDRAGELHHAELRHRRPDVGHDGWTRLGLATSQVERSEPIEVQARATILDDGLRSRAWRRVELAGAMARQGPQRALRRVARTPSAQPEIELVEYPNDRGEPIRALVNSTGDRRGAPAVLIAPAWGRTKETLLPLAATLVRSFEKAGEALSVLRFDGTNRRGESYIDPECREPGDEYLHFTFTQAVRDITAGFDFLERDPRFRASKILLVTYSLGAVEGRRALREDAGRRAVGWVSVVGMVDLQSGLRTVSGGVDYAYGLARGVHFGRHELVGVTADMDHTGLDAMASKLVFAEDAHRDMAEIEVPVSWIHGRHDAWMDIERVRRMLSAGDTSRRKLVEVPAGHQMRSSREALETFALVATEAGRMLLGRELRPAIPDLAELATRTTAERERRPAKAVALREFWGDYLLGRDRRLGIELMTATSAYRELMALQIARLELVDGDRVADLGAGTGDFPLLLARRDERPSALRITEIDYVTEALRRGRERLRSQGPSDGFEVARVAANLDMACGRGLPLADCSQDAVLASLLLCYLSSPELLLGSARRVLVPGGRLVLSTLRRDADISQVYVCGTAELPPDRVRSLFGEEAARDFDTLQRRFLNDASRLLDLEEAGQFQFWDAAELEAMVEAAGFSEIRIEAAFGDPPQALVLNARRT